MEKASPPPSSANLETNANIQSGDAGKPPNSLKSNQAANIKSKKPPECMMLEPCCSRDAM